MKAVGKAPAGEVGLHRTSPTDINRAGNEKYDSQSRREDGRNKWGEFRDHQCTDLSIWFDRSAIAPGLFAVQARNCCASRPLFVHSESRRKRDYPVSFSREINETNKSRQGQRFRISPTYEFNAHSRTHLAANP